MAEESLAAGALLVAGFRGYRLQRVYHDTAQLPATQSGAHRHLVCDDGSMCSSAVCLQPVQCLRLVLYAASPWPSQLGQAPRTGSGSGGVLLLHLRIYRRFS